MVVSARYVQFGGFQLDSDSGELRAKGRTVRLPDQSFRILQVLLERPGELVTREELRARLWAADTFVDFDAGLNNAVKKLRDALEDSSDHPRFIQTVPRRGYRLIAPIDGPRTARRGRRGAVAIAVALAALAVAMSLDPTRTWLRRRLALSSQAPAIRSLVVVPFQNLSGDAAQDYFVDGVTDAVTTNLAQIGTLRVISRTSAMQYKGAAKRLTDIARELDVDAAVEGSVSRVGDRIVVRAQLIQAAEDRHLWAETYERDQRDLLMLQADIAMAIARAVHLRMGSDEQQRVARAHTVSPDTYDAYLRGRFEWNRRTPEGMLKAIRCFEEAIAKNSRYAPAYSGLSDTYRFLDMQGLAAPAEAMPKAETAARQALDLDDSLAEAHASLAGVLYRYRWEWQAAEREFRRSLDLEPSYAEGRRAYGGYLSMMRRFDESLEQFRRARQLNPLSLESSMDFARALFHTGHRDEAIAELNRGRGLFPTSDRADTELAYEYLRQRRWTEAIAVFEKRTRAPRPMPWLGFAYGVGGRTAEARAILDLLQQRARTNYVSPQLFATVYLGLGERDEVFKCLEQAYEQRAFERGFGEGLVEFLHDDPRFQDLLRRMGLADFKEFKEFKTLLSHP
jgi:TolB-like protein/DNA-binding winged helix-turn-helix (wHTH) protein/Tfp pilus assembly protein PilF